MRSEAVKEHGMIAENEKVKVIFRPKHWFIPKLPKDIWTIQIFVKKLELLNILQKHFDSEWFLYHFPTELETIEWVASLMDI